MKDEASKQPQNKKSEYGGALLELALVTPLLLMLLSAVITAGPYIHIGIAVQQASSDCAISAAQSLNEAQGYMQGLAAAQSSFNTFGLSMSNVDFRLKGNWERGGLVKCAVSYDVPFGKLPMRQILFLPDVVSYSVTLPVQFYKSTWR